MSENPTHVILDSLITLCIVIMLVAIMVALSNIGAMLAEQGERYQQCEVDYSEMFAECTARLETCKQPDQ